MTIRGRQRGNPNDRLISKGATPAIALNDVASVYADAKISAGDYAIVTPTNAAAGALLGTATGLYSVVADGTVTLHFPAAAGGETFNVVVFPGLL